MANSKRTKTKVAPVQQQGITPQNMEMIQQMQDMQAAENQQKILTQEADNKQHDPDSEQTPDPQMIVITDKDVKRAMGILQKYKECKANLEKRIIENEEWFKMQHWPMIQKEQKKDDIRPASAWLFNSIINKHADIMDNFPEALILPRERSDEETAKTLSSVIPVILQQNDYEQVYSDIGWYKLKTGSSAQSICWDNTKLNGLGDISIKKCDIINLFWQSGITDIQDSANVFYVTLVDNDELKKNYPNLKSLGNYPELDVNKYIYDDQVDTTEKSAVVDWYYKQHVSGYDKDGIPQTKTILQYCKFCNGQVLFASENDPQMREEGFYKHGMYPFVIDTMYPEEGMLCGFSDIDVMKDCQAYIDKMQQAILDNALSNSRNRAIFNDQAGINEKEFSDPSCTLVHANGNLGENAYRPLEGKPLNGIYVTVLNNKIQELKDTSGNTASSQGQASSVTSASGIASLQEAAGKLARDSNKSAYRAFARVVQMVIELIRQFYTEERCFRITGDDGEQDFVSFDNSGLLPRKQGQAFEIDLGNRLPIFDTEIRPAKKSAYSKESQNQMALNFYAAGFFAPANADAAIACLNMMEFDGKEKTLAQIKQNQTLFAQVMKLQQMVQQLTAVVDAQNGTNLSGQTPDVASTAAMSGTDTKGGTTTQSRGSLTTQAASAARNATSPR
ncbi:hypothetical protein MSB04_01110 [bacterium]|nr:hypothetical protein [bacterium]